MVTDFVYVYSTYTYTSLNAGRGSDVDVYITTAVYNIQYTHPSGGGVAGFAHIIAVFAVLSGYRGHETLHRDGW